MSDEKQDPYHFYYNPMLYNIISQPASTPQPHQNMASFDHPSTTFADYLHGSMDYKTLSRAFDMSCSSSEVVSPADHGSSKKGTTTAAHVVVGDLLENNNNNLSSLHNSSMSSSSNEAVTEEDSGKSKNGQDAKEGDDHHGDDKSKKVNKPKKKEKGEKQPRFAFLTKTEIDNLEDGYRWRKYGQKAVKNSPYPRSYYRCTTQKCTVKKRVERSFQDPSIVITTYEGQHNHQCPVTLRGNAGMIPPTLLASSSMPPIFPHDFLSQLLPNRSSGNPSSFYYQHLVLPQQQQLQVQDYGMLQDLVPPFVHHKQEPN